MCHPVPESEIFPKLLLGKLHAIEVVGHSCKPCPNPHFSVKETFILYFHLVIPNSQGIFLLPLRLFSGDPNGITYVHLMAYVVEVGTH